MTGNMGHSQVIWLTGVSGAGKTTIAEEIAENIFLRSDPYPCIILDADKIRAFWPELGMSDADRAINVWRMARLARMLGEQLDSGRTPGIIIVACIAPDCAARDAAMRFIREEMPCHEVYLYAPLEERVKRDPKGLYQRAIDGEIDDLTGYNGKYDVPVSPHLSFDTSKLSAVKISLKITEELL
jgi:adenylylsulfate kinase